MASNSQSSKKNALATRPDSPETAGPRHRHPDTHTVAEGETLEQIAAKASTTVARLKQLNGIKDPEHIWPGMLLRLY